MALIKHVFSRRYLSIVALIVTYSLFSFAISQAADAPGTKGPIGTTGKTTPGVTGPVKGTTPSKLKSDIIVINAPVKKVSGAKGSTGSTGAQGLTGPQGAQGEEGEEGSEDAAEETAAEETAVDETPEAPAAEEGSEEETK